MKYSSDKINQTVVAEKYCPTLSDEYTNRFQLLIKRLQSTLQINRIRIIQEEISEALKERNESNELECNRYIASLSVLVDLSQQGWIFDIQDGELTLKMENNNVDEKEKIRYRLSAERNAQFKNESVAKFIRYMETERLFKNHIISITCLIGNKDILINTIRNNQAICEPYIQLVTNERDEYNAVVCGKAAFFEQRKILCLDIVELVDGAGNISDYGSYERFSAHRTHMTCTVRVRNPHL